MNAIVKQEVKSIDDLLTAVDHSYQEVEILGMTTKLRPVTILECLRLIKRFPKLVDIFEPKVDKDGSLLPDEMQTTQLDLFLNCGIEAAAGFIACAAGKEGDLAFEHLITTKPDDLTLGLFSSAIKVTLGEGSLDDFFSKIAGALNGIFPTIPVSPAPDEKAA